MMDSRKSMEASRHHEQTGIVLKQILQTSTAAGPRYNKQGSQAIASNRKQAGTAIRLNAYRFRARWVIKPAIGKLGLAKQSTIRLPRRQDGGRAKPYYSAEVDRAWACMACDAGSFWQDQPSLRLSLQ